MASNQTAQPGTKGQQEADLPQDFESALAELESLVTKMEDGALPLDDSLRAYQRGVELARICQQRLDVAEEQVKVLQGSLLKSLDDSTVEGDA
ncbi:MAG: exodeoxyribonuclease VII small subunit [Burkholderiaceae bacterium]